VFVVKVAVTALLAVTLRTHVAALPLLAQAPPQTGEAGGRVRGVAVSVSVVPEANDDAHCAPQ